MAQRPNTNRTESGAKRRWTADDRAKRTTGGAAPHRGAARRPEPDAGSRAGRRDARFGSDDRRPAEGGDRQDRRNDWYPGPRNGGANRGGAGARRDDRPARDERSARDDRRGDDRPRTFDRAQRPDRDAPRTGFRGASSRGDAPYRANRDERPRTDRDRTDRPRFDRDRSERPRTERSGGDRPTYGAPERPRFDRGADRPARDERRDERPARDDRRGADRPGFDRAREDRPRFDRPREDRPREDRPRFDRPARDDRRTDDRRGADRPGFDRAREDRPRFDRSREDRPREDRPRFDRPARDDRRTDDRRGADRPGFDRAREDRPRFDRSREDRPREDRPREDRPREDRPRFERPAREDRPRFDRSDDRPNQRTDRPFREDRDRAPRRDDRAPRRDDWSAGQDAGRFTAPDDVVLERLQGEVVTAAEVSGSSFTDLGLGEQITRALADLGASSPFPIQAATIPDVLAGRNVLGRGRTGSGKTIAFGAGLIERLMRNWADTGRTGTGRRVGRAPRALILAPTRELALQIDRTVQPIARSVGLFTTQIVGGVPQARQVGALAKGVDIVIGTPGRIEDLIEQRRLDLSEIEITVLDEADHMADLGFLEPMQRLLRRVPSKGQRLLFSATLDAAVASLVAEFMPEPAVHEVADTEGGGTADHRVLVIEQGEKLNVLTALLASVDRTLVFARTRAFAEQLADELDGAGVKAESLHGDLNQARRTRNLARFGEGRVSALVATDVAARGIHVDSIDLVVHADAAEDYKTYLHRSGRTGRAGASGTVVTLINARRRRRFTELLERADIDAEFITVGPGQDPVAALRGAQQQR